MGRPLWPACALRPAARGGEALLAYVLKVGADGVHILDAVHRDEAPLRLRDLPAVQALRQVWVHQYWFDEEGELRWRGPKSTRDRVGRRKTEQRNTDKTSADGRPDPATARVPWSSMEIVTPHDPEARYSQKVTAAGQCDWIGYRDHQTETCDDSGPNVIVQVVTRPAPEQDVDALDRIHQGLAEQGFHPIEHVVDGGYSAPDSIHHAAETWGITLFGPVRDAPGGKKRPGFTKEDIHVDWQARTLACPHGVTSPPGNRPSATGIRGCPCSSRAKPAGNATTGSNAPATSTAREQKTDQWRRRYAIRAGIIIPVSIHGTGRRLQVGVETPAAASDTADHTHGGTTVHRVVLWPSDSHFPCRGSEGRSAWTWAADLPVWPVRRCRICSRIGRAACTTVRGSTVFATEVSRIATTVSQTEGGRWRPSR